VCDKLAHCKSDRDILAHLLCGESVAFRRQEIPGERENGERNEQTQRHLGRARIWE
jgi:hypothetical protein